MVKFNVQENLSMSRLNKDNSDMTNMIMIVDLFSSLNMPKFFKQQKPPIDILPDMFQECKKTSNCKNSSCNSFNELVMLKEFGRDEKLFDKLELNIINNKSIIVNNGHIYNMSSLSLNNEKLYKIYMREFKHRKYNWNYIAFLVKKKISTEHERKLYDAMCEIVSRADIDYIVFDVEQYKSETYVKKDIRTRVLEYL